MHAKDQEEKVRVISFTEVQYRTVCLSVFAVPDNIRLQNHYRI